jgi:hypothetical protein
MLDLFRPLKGHWLLEQTAKQDDEVAISPFSEHQFWLGDLWGPMWVL